MTEQKPDAKTTDRTDQSTGARDDSERISCRHGDVYIVAGDSKADYCPGCGGSLDR